MIDVVEEQVERGDPLDDAGLDLRHSAAVMMRGMHVERQDAVDRVAVGVDGEGDAEVQQVALGVRGAAAQRLDRQVAQSLAQQGKCVMRRLARPQHLAEQAARVVVRQYAVPPHCPLVQPRQPCTIACRTATGLRTLRAPRRCPIRGRGVPVLAAADQR